MTGIRLLLVSGSTRELSTNTAALRTARDVVPDGVEAVLYGGLAHLPAFNPDLDPELPPAVAELRREIAGADAVLLCTPEYAGTLPGSLKNLLDWTVGGGELYGKPVAWLTVAAPGRGLGAEATLESVLGYVGADIARDACARLPVARSAVDAAGVIADPVLRAGIADACARLVRHVTAARPPTP